MKTSKQPAIAGQSRDDGIQALTQQEIQLVSGGVGQNRFMGGAPQARNLSAVSSQARPAGKTLYTS